MMLRQDGNSPMLLQSANPSQVNRWFFTLIAVVTICVTILSGQSAPADDNKPLRVRLIIDYNDGVEKHFTKIPWKKGMTVLDAMNHARRGSHGLSFKSTGKGGSTFLQQIDDLKNQGGGTGKKNWILRVNKKLATQSFGIAKLKSADIVRWRFEAFKF